MRIPSGQNVTITSASLLRQNHSGRLVLLKMDGFKRRWAFQRYMKLLSARQFC